MGCNSTRELYNGCRYCRHAETDALQHLPPNRSKRWITLDLLVVRVTKTGNIKNSRPCVKCIEFMMKVSGYKIRNVYYSNSNGEIVCEKLLDLYHSEEQHVSLAFKKKYNKDKDKEKDKDQCIIN